MEESTIGREDASFGINLRVELRFNALKIKFLSKRLRRMLSIYRQGVLYDRKTAQITSASIVTLLL